MGSPASHLRTLLIACACSLAACEREPRRTIPLPPQLERLDSRVAERIVSAVEELRAAPLAPERWMHLGMTYEANDLFAPAVECYERAVELEPSAKHWHRKACAEAGRGDWDAAAQAMRRSIELEPGYAPSHWRLGSYLFDLGQFEEALRSFTEVTRLDPDHFGGPTGIARVHIQRGEPERALAVLEATLNANPEEPTALRLLRTAYLQAGRAGDAEKTRVPWRKQSLLGRDPWQREFREYRERPLMERALDLLQSGDAAKAVELLEEFTAERPDDLNAVAYLAQGYALTHRDQEALRAVEEALAREPNNLLVLRVLARIQGDAGQDEELLSTLEKVVTIDPNDIESWRKKGWTEARVGRSAEALESLRRVFALDRREPEILVDIGELELALGRFEEALRTFEEALASGVSGPRFFRGLARAYSHAGRLDDALSVLERAPYLDEEGQRLLDECRAAKEKSRE